MANMVSTCEGVSRSMLESEANDEIVFSLMIEIPL